MNKSRPPNELEQVKIKELWDMGLGSPKIAQLVGISAFQVQRWMKDNGFTRTKDEMFALRKKNGINFKNITVPKRIAR